MDYLSRQSLLNFLSQQFNETQRYFLIKKNTYWNKLTIACVCCFILCSMQSTITHAATVNSIAAGSWGTGSTWSTGSTPGNGDVVNINNPLTLNSNMSPSTGAVYTFNAASSGFGTLNMGSGAILDIRANVTFTGSGFNMNGGIIYVRSGYTLTLPGFNESSTAIYVESGATLVVNGNLLNNHGTIQVDGTLTVNGNYDGQAADAGVTGSGDFTTTGYMKGINTSMVFGVIPNCNGPGCNGRSLCTGFTAIVSPSSSDVCTILGSQLLTATVTPSTPAPAYQWVSSSTETGTYSDVAGQTNSTYTVGVTGNSKMYYRVKVTRSCTRYSDPVYINTSLSLNLLALITSITGTTAVCQNTLQTYSASTSNATDYIWTVPTGSVIVSGQGTSSISVLIGSTSGSIAVTAKNGCYSNNATKSITVTPTLAAPGSITGSANLCQNSTGKVFSIAAVSGATGYTWLLPSGASITNGINTNSINVTMGTSSGNVIVTPTNTCGGSSSSSVLAVTISSAVPSAAGTITGTTPVCSGVSGVAYSIPSVSGASSYSWTLPSGVTVAAGIGTNAVTLNWGSAAGSVMVTPVNACGNGTASTLAVAINTVPSGAGTITGSVSVCAGQTLVAYNIPSSTGATGYTWTLPSGSVISGGTGNSITATIGTTSGNLSVVPSNGCGNGAGSNVFVTVNALPLILSTTPAARCNTGSITLSAVASAGNIDWFAGSSGGSSLATGTSYSPAVTGTTTFYVQASNSGCVSAVRTAVVATVNICPVTWTGTTSTAWATSTNWNYGSVPTSADAVIIPSGVPNNPTISASQNTAALTINSGGTLTISSAGTLNAYGDITNNGTLTTVAGSTVAFKGSTAQIMTGVSALYNVVINNTGGVTLQSALGLNGILSLTKGVLTTNSKLTINFDNGGYIGYATGDLGSISGMVTGQRGLVAKTHYIAAPFSGVTSAQVAATTPLYLNSYWKLYSRTFASQNWLAITDLSTAMPVGTGYSLALPTAASLIFSGTYDHTLSFSSPSYTNTASGKYLFFGNPYPSPIDWDNASGWTKNNVGAAVYYWDAANNRVASYVGGVGANGGTQYIPAMQAVLVDLNGAGGTASLAVNNEARKNTQIKPFMRTASDDLIRIHLEDSAASKNDETVIRFNDQATNNFDHAFDAHKIMNSGSMPSVYTTSGLEQYSINSYASADSAKFIPVAVKLPAGGKYTLTIVNDNPNLEYVLLDKQMGIEQSINESYTFSGLTTDDVNRFELQHRTTTTMGVQTASKDGGLEINSSAEDGFYIQTKRYAGSVAEIEILDAAGKSIAVLPAKNLSAGTTFVPLDLPGESYLVKVYTGSNIFSGVIILVK